MTIEYIERLIRDYFTIFYATIQYTVNFVSTVHKNSVLIKLDYTCTVRTLNTCTTFFLLGRSFPTVKSQHLYYYYLPKSYVSLYVTDYNEVNLMLRRKCNLVYKSDV